MRSTAPTPHWASTSKTASSWRSTSTTPPIPGCQIQLKPFDTEGDPQKATAIAPQIVDDQYTIGLVGPAFSGETKATGGVFDQAGLVAVTASATNPTLSENGWKTFFRGLANDAVQGPSVANYMKTGLSYEKVCVIDDSTDYGLGLATAVRDTLGPVGRFGRATSR